MHQFGVFNRIVIYEGIGEVIEGRVKAYGLIYLPNISLSLLNIIQGADRIFLLLFFLFFIFPYFCLLCGVILIARHY